MLNRQRRRTMQGNIPLRVVNFGHAILLGDAETGAAIEAMRKVYYTPVKVCKTRDAIGTQNDDLLEAIG